MQEDCQHIHTKLVTTGSMHFDGEPWDDYRDEVICLDCLQNLTETPTKKEKQNDHQS